MSCTGFFCYEMRLIIKEVTIHIAEVLQFLRKGTLFASKSFGYLTGRGSIL